MGLTANTMPVKQKKSETVGFIHCFCCTLWWGITCKQGRRTRTNCVSIGVDAERLRTRTALTVSLPGSTADTNGVAWGSRWVYSSRTSDHRRLQQLPWTSELSDRITGSLSDSVHSFWISGVSIWGKLCAIVVLNIGCISDLIWLCVYEEIVDNR